MELFGVGPGELILVMVVALIFIGPAKLPEIASSLGKAIGEFRRATSQMSEELTREVRTEMASQEAARTEESIALEPAQSAPHLVEESPVETTSAASNAPLSLLPEGEGEINKLEAELEMKRTASALEIKRLEAELETRRLEAELAAKRHAALVATASAAPQMETRAPEPAAETPQEKAAEPVVEIKALEHAANGRVSETAAEAVHQPDPAGGLEA